MKAFRNQFRIQWRSSVALFLEPLLGRHAYNTDVWAWCIAGLLLLDIAMIWILLD